MDELKILQHCAMLGQEYPHLVGKMRDALDSGLQEAFNRQRNDAAQWEIVANTALSLIDAKRVSPSHKKWATDLFNAKIKELSVRGCLNWSSYLDEKENL